MTTSISFDRAITNRVIRLDTQLPYLPRDASIELTDAGDMDGCYTVRSSAYTVNAKTGESELFITLK